jgi:hypothetical protein
MTSRLLLTAAGCLLLHTTARADGPPTARAGSLTTAENAGPAVRIGRIFVVEQSDHTSWKRYHVILYQLALSPGRVVNHADLRRAEDNLARLSWLFLVDKDVRPTVQALETEAQPGLKDVLVTVRDRPLVPHVWRLVDTAEKLVEFECVRRAIGPLAVVPLEPSREQLVADRCAEAALALIQGDAREPLIDARILWTSLPWVWQRSTPAAPEIPAPPS